MGILKYTPAYYRSRAEYYFNYGYEKICWEYLFMAEFLKTDPDFVWNDCGD